RCRPCAMDFPERIDPSAAKGLWPCRPAIVEDHETDALALRPVKSSQSFSYNRKSTRLNSSHVSISYAVFCLKKKKKNTNTSFISNLQSPHNTHYTRPYVGRTHLTYQYRSQLSQQCILH